MEKNKVLLIQVWFGKIPEYFWYHYETTKNLKGFDFLFFTDQDLIVESSNYKVIKTTKKNVENLLSACLNKKIEIKNNKKACDLKASFGQIFSNFISGYEYYGAYDLDTLFGDVYNYTTEFIGDYDIITVADEVYHNRISGPFVLFKNDEKLKSEYLSEEYVKCFENHDVECFEENFLFQKIKDKYKIKFIYSINCETLNGGKNTYSCFWRGGQVFVNGEQKLLYHFYRKKLTDFKRIGDMIIAKYKKILVDDFYWVVSFTQDYEKLFLNLLKSIKKYSNRKCVIYSINYNFILPLEELSNEQFIIRRIDIPEGEKDIRNRDHNIISSKPLINLDVINHFPNKKFICIDSDIYLTVNSDNIINFSHNLENYPLINSHIHEVIYLNGINPEEEWTSPLHLLLGEMCVENFVVPRRKTNVMIFDINSKWFFEEQMEIYKKYKGVKPGILALHDEDTANALLSKYNLNNSLPLLDIEEVNDIDMNVFFKYSYNMTPISEFVRLPKNKNEVLFFHGIKSQEHYDKIVENYDSQTIDCEEMFINYVNNTLIFEKNSFFTNKNLPEKVNFEIYDRTNQLLFSLDEQLIKKYFMFYISNIFLPSGQYTLKISDTESKNYIFKDIFRVE